MTETNNEIDVMYFHGTTVDGCRYTIAGVIKDEYLQLGAAICSESNHFSKSKGRTIATGRVLNQRKHPKGRTFLSLYNEVMGAEFRGRAGFPKHYYVGKEIKVFRDYVMNFNHFTKKELQQEFRLLKLQEKKVRVFTLSPDM